MSEVQQLAARLLAETIVGLGDAFESASAHALIVRRPEDRESLEFAAWDAALTHLHEVRKAGEIRDHMARANELAEMQSLKVQVDAITALFSQFPLEVKQEARLTLKRKLIDAEPGSHEYERLASALDVFAGKSLEGEE